MNEGWVSMMKEQNMKEAGSIDPFISDFSDESSASLGRPALEQDEANSILNWSSLDQSVEDQSKQISEKKPGPDVVSDDSLQGLGELRFAEDD